MSIDTTRLSAIGCCRVKVRRPSFLWRGFCAIAGYRPRRPRRPRRAGRPTTRPSSFRRHLAFHWSVRVGFDDRFAGQVLTDSLGPAIDSASIFSLSLSLRRPTGKYVKASDDMPSSELPGFDWDSPPPSRASVAASTRPADRSAPYSTGPYRRRRRQIEALPSHFRPASARRFSGALGRLRDRRRFAFPQRRNR